MNVHVSEHWRRFIQDEIQRGRFASADQMIDEALRLLKESAGQVADEAQRLLKEHNQAPAGSAPMAGAAAGPLRRRSLSGRLQPISVRAFPRRNGPNSPLMGPSSTIITSTARRSGPRHNETGFRRHVLLDRPPQ